MFISKKSIGARALGATLALALGTTAFGQLSGAIFTSKQDGLPVNSNHYATKPEVYLNGGANNTSSGSGLPVGEYYFQVTTPSGVLLSSDDVRNRRVLVGLNGFGQGVFMGPLPDPVDGITYPGHAAGDYEPISGSTAVQLIPFGDSPNGVYKVWVTPVDKYSAGSGTNGFLGAWSKTDNFKVGEDGPPPPTPQSELLLEKFYDANVNGAWDPLTEQLVGGFRFEVTYTDPDGNVHIDEVVTNVAGQLSINVKPGTEYEVCEIIPGTGDPDCYWQQTMPNEFTPGATFDGTRWCYTGIAPNEGSTAYLDFGNACLCNPTGGKTLGFWSNKNGQKLVGADDLAMLVALNLRKANGTDFDPGTYSSLKTWLLNGTATNMSYMLSVQLAATKLSLFNGLLSSGTGVVLPADIAFCIGLSGNVISLADLTNMANTELGLHGLVLSGSPYRDYQECLKDACDGVNNNWFQFVHDGPCEIVYAEPVR